MRTLLFTGFDAAYWPLAQLTVPRMVQYAQRHGYDFQVFTTPLLDVPNGIYWTGVAGALKALKNYDRVMYLDCDQLITNFDWELQTDWNIQAEITGFHASKDWGQDAVEPWQFSMAGFLADAHCRPLFEEVLSMEPHWRDKPFPEQNPMQASVKNRLRFPALADLFFFHSRRIFNAVPDAVSPGNVPEPWQKGDFAAHITMLSIDERVKLAQTIIHDIG